MSPPKLPPIVPMAPSTEIEGMNEVLEMMGTNVHVCPGDGPIETQYSIIVTRQGHERSSHGWFDKNRVALR